MEATFESRLKLSGARSFEIRRGGSQDPEPPKDMRIRDIIKHALPITRDEDVNLYRLKNLLNVWRGLWRIMVARALGISHRYGAVYATLIKGDGRQITLGLVSLRVVTTAGVNKLVAGLNASDTSTFSAFKYHGFGTGTTAEASGDTALVTEFTTEYLVNSTRPTGSQTTGGSSNIYRSVATFTPDSGGVLAVTEHGVFSNATVGSGTLVDRSKFAPMNLDTGNGDSLQITYDLTLPAGG